jgi:hypothetical protein
MAKITKLEAAGRQLDSAIRMFFANEEHFGSVWNSVRYHKEGEANVALDAHIKRSARRDLAKRQNS